MPDRSIKIVPVNPADPKGSASFAPQGGHPGGTQEAWEGDDITWNNSTDAEHWPWPTDANYQPLTLDCAGTEPGRLSVRQYRSPQFVAADVFAQTSAAHDLLLLQESPERPA